MTEETDKYADAQNAVLDRFHDMLLGLAEAIIWCAIRDVNLSFKLDADAWAEILERVQERLSGGVPEQE